MAVSGGTVLKGVVIVAGVVAVLLVLLWLGQRRLIYLPDTAPVPPAAEVIPGAEDVALRTDDGLTLGAWHVPAASDGADMTVLVANGNGGNREGRAALARALSEAGFDVLLFDYRGYGGNDGGPTEEGLALDVRAAHRHLVDERGVTADRLLYFGESLGTAVVTELAAEHPPAGLLLRSPFPDLAAAAGTHFPFLPIRLLLRDHYPLTGHLARVEAPVTVVYGTRDTVIPPELSQQVAAATAGPVDVVAVEGADHNDPVMFDGPELITAVVELARR